MILENGIIGGEGLWAKIPIQAGGKDCQYPGVAQ